MVAQTQSYDGVHFQVALMNMRDGSVQGHAAGCADLKRGIRKFAEPFQADDIIDVLSKQEARESYNADFDEELDGWYEIEWLPCAKHIPATHEVDEVAAEIVANAEGEDLVESADDEIIIKPGRIWTYIYRGETLLAEVRTDSAAAVIAALS